MKSRIIALPVLFLSTTNILYRQLTRAFRVSIVGSYFDCRRCINIEIVVRNKKSKKQRIQIAKRLDSRGGSMYSCRLYLHPHTGN